GKAIHTVVADGDSNERAVYETWPDGLEMCGTLEGVVRAKFAALKADNERKIKGITFPTMRDRGQPASLCAGLYRTAFDDGLAFPPVVSFALDDDKAPATTATLQSRPGAVFASAGALYLSVAHRKAKSGQSWYSFYPSVDEVSDLHKFKIGASPRDTRY